MDKLQLLHGNLTGWTCAGGGRVFDVNWLCWVEGGSWVGGVAFDQVIPLPLTKALP